MDITFHFPEGHFQYRAAGIFIHDGKVLVTKDDYPLYYYLPGGRIKLHEPSGEAILREISEELQEKVSVERLCYIVESFFVEEVSQERFHEVAFYYQLSVPDTLFAEGDEFTRTEGIKAHRFYWKAISELSELYFQPAFLKERLTNLPERPEHLVLWNGVSGR